MAKKEDWNDTRKKAKQLGPSVETLLEMVKSDWDAFVQVLREKSLYHQFYLDRLVPAIRARPELCKRLLEVQGEVGVCRAWQNIEAIRDWLPHQAIDPTATLGFARVAQKLAQRYDPDFPDISGFTTSMTSSRGLWDHRSHGSHIQDGRGWQYRSVTTDGERHFAPRDTTETTAIAIHPEWRLTVHCVDNEGEVRAFWWTFEAWGKVPKKEVNVVGMAQVDRALGPILTGRLVVGSIAPEHGVRLLRDGKVRWQGKFEELSPIQGEELPLEEGRSFMARLNVPFRMRQGDNLECFTE